MKKLFAILFVLFFASSAVLAQMAVPTAPSTTNQGETTIGVQISTGWNLIGNPVHRVIDPWTTFGNLSQGGTSIGGLTDNIVSVWKWNNTTKRWGFYSPRLSRTDMALYAKNHGIDVLEIIYSGEGYWVLSKAYTAVYLTGYLVDDVMFGWGLGGGVQNGWNMLSSPVSMTVEELAGVFDQNPPAPEMVPGSNKVMSIWGWNPNDGKWKFYSPYMMQYYQLGYMNQYIYDKEYERFNDPLQPGTGFWINYQENGVGGGKG